MVDRIGDLVEGLWFKFKFRLVKLAYLQKRSRARRYGFSIILITLVLLLNIFFLNTDLIFINSQAAVLLVFILVVGAGSWYGGLGPGILITIFISFINYLFHVGNLFFYPEIDDLLITFVYIILGFFISVISEARYEVELQKDEFVALVAHEIKNPLSTIKGFAGLLHQKYQNGNSKVSQYTKEIGFQSDKLLELVNDLLDATKIEVGSFLYRDELFDFGDLVSKIIINQKIIHNEREIILSGSSKKIIKGDSTPSA